MVMGFEGPIHKAGPTQIIGVNEQVDASDYSSTADLQVSNPSTSVASGEILAISLVSYTTGSGAAQTPAGDIYLFDTDPDTTSGSTALTAAGAEHLTLIAVVNMTSNEWFSDSVGGFCYKSVALPFHGVSKVYAVFRPSAGATSINDGGGDDERFDIQFWYRRDS